MHNVTHISGKLAIATSTNPKYWPTFNFTNENINWAGWSWNPVTGCLHGCRYCYAEARAENGFFRSGFPNGFKPTFHPGRLAAPENTKIPKDKEGLEGIRRVFVCSMADLFGDWVPAEWIQRIIDTCNENKQWDFLFLTKNPARYAEFTFPLNCWLGATADTQARADIATDAFRMASKPNIKFLSCEPLSEAIRFESLDHVNLVIIGAMKGSENTDRQPKKEWVESMIQQANRSGCEYLLKPNVTVMA